MGETKAAICNSTEHSFVVIVVKDDERIAENGRDTARTFEHVLYCQKCGEKR